MIKHKWNNNICVYCGLKREKLLISINDSNSFKHYKYERLWYYTLNSKSSYNRPDCSCFNKKGFNDLKKKFDKAAINARQKPLIINLKSIDEILKTDMK